MAGAELLEIRATMGFVLDIKLALKFETMGEAIEALKKRTQCSKLTLYNNFDFTDGP